jgi:hypothetical protein
MALIKGKQLASQTIDTRELKDAGVTPAKLLIASQTFDFSGASAFSVPAPSSSAHAATKGYVDGVAQGLDVKQSVRAASIMNLPSFTYASLKLTQAIASSWSIDGVTPILGDRLLIKNQATASENGIYTVTQVGDGVSVVWELTRSSDFNTSALASPGAFCFVEEGTAHADAGFVMSANGPITLDTSDIVWTQFSGAGQVEAGEGLSKSGNTLSVNVAAAGGIEIDTDALKLKLADSSLSSDASGVTVGLNAEGSIAIKGGAGLAAAVVRPQAGLSVASNVSADDTDTGLSLSASPAAGGFVQVLVNGILVELGNGVKTKDCYFSGDSGTTARAHNACVSGDALYWNGASVFTLETTDRVDFIYATI